MWPKMEWDWGLVFVFNSSLILQNFWSEAELFLWLDNQCGSLLNMKSFPMFFVIVVVSSMANVVVPILVLGVMMVWILTNGVVVKSGRSQENVRDFSKRQNFWYTHCGQNSGIGLCQYLR